MLASLFVVLSVAAQDSVLDRAQQSLENKRYTEALDLYKKGLTSEMKDLEPFYNGGLAAFFSGDFRQAALWWEKVAADDPADLQVLGKLVQAYQSLGDKQNRDRRREDLLKAWRASKDADKPDRFCREQVRPGNARPVMVFEFFEMKGDRAVRYVFVEVGDDGKETGRVVSLGSYDATNAIHSRVESKKNTRLFHLDFYFRQGHATHGFFEGEPHYDTIRDKALAILGPNPPRPASQTIVRPPK